MDIRAIIHQVANQFLPGDAEFEKVLNAIAMAESGGRPDAIGDGGWSIGLFQNHMRDGRGKGYTAEQLKDPLFNTQLAAKELVNYYLQGKQQGIKGAQLATFVSKYGQRPQAGNEVHAGENYGRFVGSVTTNQSQAPIITKEQLLQNEGKYLQNLTGERNKVTPRMQFEVDFKKYNETPKKKTGIMDFVNFLLSATTPQAYAQGATPSNRYTVQGGDTLWGIAQNTLGSGNRWKELQGYSGDPRQLPIGTQLTMPQPARAKMPQPDFSPSSVKTPSAAMKPLSQPSLWDSVVNWWNTPVSSQTKMPTKPVNTSTYTPRFTA